MMSWSKNSQWSKGLNHLLLIVRMFRVNTVFMYQLFHDRKKAYSDELPKWDVALELTLFVNIKTIFIDRKQHFVSNVMEESINQERVDTFKMLSFADQYTNKRPGII